MARQRHPGEPIAGLPRRYEAGGAGRPPRCRRPPLPRTTPYWGMGSQIRRAGDEVSGSPRLRWGHGREGGEQVRGDVRDRHHEPAGSASSLAAARAIQPGRGRRRDHRADLLRRHQLDADQRRTPATTATMRPACWSLLAFVACAPLALRTRFPLGAWAFSAAALIWTSLVIPPGSIGGPDVPVAGALVYGLCLYAVTVRCRPRIVVAAAAVTVAGAAFIDPGSTAPGRLPDRGPHPPRRRGPGAAQRRSASSRSRSAGTPASARCSRSGSASPGSCTTWSPTTCR